MSCRTDRDARHVPVDVGARPTRPARPGRARSAATGPSSSQARGHLGVQLADAAELRAVAGHGPRPGAPGMQERALAGLGAPLHAGRLEQRVHQRPGGVVVGRPARGAPARRLADGEQGGEVMALLGRRGALGRVRREPRRAAPTAGRRAPTRTGASSSRPCAALWAAASSRPGSSSGRITLWSSLSGFSRRSAGSPSRRSRASAARRRERVRHRLVQPAVAQRVLEPAPEPLLLGERAHGRAARRQRGRQLVEAVDAGHLLDQVDLALDVAARARAAPPSPPPARLEPEPGEDLLDLAGVDPLAQQALHPVEAQRNHDVARPAPGTRRACRARAGRRRARPSAAPPAAAPRSPGRGEAASRSGRRPRCAARAPWRCA